MEKSLPEKLQKAHTNAFSLFALVPSGVFIEDPEFFVLKNPKLGLISNSIFQTRIEASDIRSSIERGISYFKDSKSSFFWRQWPIDLPLDLSAELKTMGFREQCKCAILAQSATGVSKSAQQTKISNQFHTSIVSNASQLKSWADVLSESYAVSREESSLFESLQSPQIMHTILYDKDRAVACMSAIISDNFCGLFNGGTLLSDQRRGCFRKLLHDTLHLASEKFQPEYFYAETVPESYPELKRLGFEDFGFSTRYQFDFKN